MKFLIDSNSKFNAMTPIVAHKLSLISRSSNIFAQKINAIHL